MKHDTFRYDTSIVENSAEGRFPLQPKPCRILLFHEHQTARPMTFTQNKSTRYDAVEAENGLKVKAAFAITVL